VTCTSRPPDPDAHTTATAHIRSIREWYGVREDSRRPPSHSTSQRTPSTHNWYDWQSTEAELLQQTRLSLRCSLLVACALRASALLRSYLVAFDHPDRVTTAPRPTNASMYNRMTCTRMSKRKPKKSCGKRKEIKHTLIFYLRIILSKYNTLYSRTNIRYLTED
jgi:hypothetical protein